MKCIQEISHGRASTSQKCALIEFLFCSTSRIEVMCSSQSPLEKQFLPPWAIFEFMILLAHGGLDGIAISTGHCQQLFSKSTYE